MAVEAGWLRRQAGWNSGRGQPGRARLMAELALGLAAVCGGLEVFQLARLTEGVRSIALAVACMAAVLVLAVVAIRWMHAALESRVELLTQALDASPDAQLIIGPDGRMAYTNTAFTALFPGVGDDPPLDRIAAALADDPQAAIDFRRLRSQAAAGTRAIAALPLRDASGGTAGWFTISVNPIAGRPGFSFWNVQDVTARHQMEAVIRDERNKLVDFLDHAPIGAYSVDGDGRFLFANRTLGEWLGAAPEDMVGDGALLREFVAAPEEMTAPWDPFAGRDEGSGRGEVALRGRQGRVVHAWIGQSVVGTGSELRTRAVVRDLTPEREWESARERFQLFFADAPVGIALVDRDGRFAEANRAVGELIGAPVEALIGERFVDFLNEENRSGIAARLTAAAAGQPLSGPLEFRLKAPSERALVAFMSRLGEVAGAGPSLILHVIDVTEQKHLEAQFAQSQKMQAVGQLAGGVAHDFNNLLTAMTGFCDLLLLRFRPGDPSYADIMQIKQNANRAAGLVRQLLAFSRKQPLQPRVLDMTDVLYELRHLLQRLIGENIELKLVHGRDLGLVKVDQGYFEQVIINLAVNARDAMPNGGTVTIRTANVSESEPVRRGPEIMPAGDYVMIEVADTGIGIPKENLARIFEPFFTTKEVGSGTGLGLSTVYGIVRQTGGFVFVDSAPGEGAQFRIYLPRHHASEATAAEDRLDGGEPALSRDLTGAGTVMLVEDDDPVRIFGARALRNKGYKVVEAKSGEMALELIHEAAEPIDLLVTDVVMPRLDGPGLIRQVRETHPDMKVIFISGYTEDSFRQRLDSDRDIHFLPKPFSLKQLAAKVKAVISGDEA